MGVLKLALLAAAVLAAYGGVCLVKPYRRCGRCRGSPRRSRRYLGAWGPMGKCRRCRGQMRHQRLGARVVHRYFWLAVGEPLRERRRKRLEGNNP